MRYTLNLSPLPFEAIKNKTKTIEGRPSKTINDRYAHMKAGDEIVFVENTTKERLSTIVVFVHHYSTVRLMLEKEGIENILPNETTVDGGEKIYNKIADYNERIKKYGIYAIGIKVT